ncbi:MAG: O-methyltransferase [Pseudomonadales bacterium]
MFKIRNKLLQLPQITWFVTKLMAAPVAEKVFSLSRREEAVRDYVLEHATVDDSAAVLAAMDEFASNKRWLMNIGPKKGEILVGAISSLKKTHDIRMLEIGAYCGYSAVLAGEQLKKRGGTLVSIEKSRRCSDVARQIIAHAGLSQTVTVHKGILEQFVDQLEQPFDIVLLDHWKDLYLPDLQLLEQAGLLQVGSVVVADNIEFFDVADYLDYVRDGGFFESTFHESSVEYNDNIKDGVEVSVLTRAQPA